jgi:hypothetical protein
LATFEAKEGAADKVRKKKKWHIWTTWHSGKEPLGTIGLKKRAAGAIGEESPGGQSHEEGRRDSPWKIRNGSYL